MQHAYRSGAQPRGASAERALGKASITVCAPILTFLPRGRRRHHSSGPLLAVKEVVVCTNSTCRKKGGKKTLEWFHAMVPEGVEIVEQDCLDECPMGPNCGYDPDGDGVVKVINGVKTKDGVAAALAQMGLQPTPDKEE